MKPCGIIVLTIRPGYWKYNTWTDCIRITCSLPEIENLRPHRRSAEWSQHFRCFLHVWVWKFISSRLPSTQRWMSHESTELSWLLPALAHPSSFSVFCRHSLDFLFKQDTVSQSNRFGFPPALSLHDFPVSVASSTHFSTLAWRIPWTEEPGGLPSMGSHRVGHYSSDLAAAYPLT